MQGKATGADKSNGRAHVSMPAEDGDGGEQELAGGWCGELEGVVRLMEAA